MRGQVGRSAIGLGNVGKLPDKAGAGHRPRPRREKKNRSALQVTARHRLAAARSLDDRIEHLQRIVVVQIGAGVRRGMKHVVVARLGGAER